jgi:AbrB family looped-hinge helix DNA binding protein
MPVISSKNQITLPVEALNAAGLRSGDDVLISATADGRIEISTPEAFIERFAGIFDSGVYPPVYLEGLRAEWD